MIQGVRLALEVGPVVPVEFEETYGTAIVQQKQDDSGPVGLGSLVNSELAEVAQIATPALGQLGPYRVRYRWLPGTSPAREGSRAECVRDQPGQSLRPHTHGLARGVHGKARECRFA